MSLFSKIKDAIFGKQAKAATPTPPPRPAGGTVAPAAVAPAPKPAAPVDVDAILSGLQAKSGEKLNWQTSIVDLMKLLGLDSSLAERKELATELGYTGALDGSADMNIWLHKRVMRELAANGGKVPAALLD